MLIRKYIDSLSTGSGCEEKGNMEYYIYIFHFHFLKMEYIFTFSGKDWAGEKRKTEIDLKFTSYSYHFAQIPPSYAKLNFNVRCQKKLRNISNNSFGRKHKKCGHIVMEPLISFLFEECIKNKQARENLKLIREGWDKKWMVKDMWKMRDMGRASLNALL